MLVLAISSRSLKSAQLPAAAMESLLIWSYCNKTEATNKTKTTYHIQSGQIYTTGKPPAHAPQTDKSTNETGTSLLFL